MFGNVSIHVVFGTFWYDGYGYVALRRDPTAFDLGGVAFFLVSNNGMEAVWRRSDDGSFVTWTNLVNSEVPCEPNPTYVKQYKMLGKKTEDHKSPPCCTNSTVASSKGKISSFSGRAEIRPAKTIMSTKYFADTSQYLRSRGESYLVNNVLSKIPGVNYVEGLDVIWPNVPQTVGGETLNSSFYQSCNTGEVCNGNAAKCSRTVFKPSNSKYTTQGAVSSAERVLRLKTENKVVRVSMTGKKIL
jgi:hypothetical protein